MKTRTWIQVAVMAAWLAMSVVTLLYDSSPGVITGTILAFSCNAVFRCMNVSFTKLENVPILDFLAEIIVFVSANVVSAIPLWRFGDKPAVVACIVALEAAHVMAIAAASVAHVRTLPLAANTVVPGFDIPLSSTGRVIEANLSADFFVRKVIDCGSERYLLLFRDKRLPSLSYVMVSTPSNTFAHPYPYWFDDMCQGPVPGTAYLVTEHGNLYVASLTEDGTDVFFKLIAPKLFNGICCVASVPGGIIALGKDGILMCRPDGSDAKRLAIGNTLWVNRSVTTTGTSALVYQARRVRPALRIVDIDLKTMAVRRRFALCGDWGVNTVGVAVTVWSAKITPISNDPSRFVCWNGSGRGVVMAVGWSALRSAWCMACVAHCK